MSSIKEDWILWANRFQTEHITLLKRVQEVERHTSHIPQLRTQIDNLADGHKKIQQSSTSLAERTVRLEGSTSSFRQDTTQELTELRAKVTALEKEKEDAHLELEQWKSQAVALLEKEYEQAQQELYRWKTQIETQSQNEIQHKDAQASGDKEMLNEPNSPLEAAPHHRPRKHHRTFSEATTADESLILTQHAQSHGDFQNLLDVSQAGGIQGTASQFPTQGIPSPPPVQESPSQLPIQDISTQQLQTQGRRTLQDYLDSGSQTIPALVRAYEAELVQNFVEKMREKSRKAILRSVLQKKGWTWEILESEVRGMIKQGKMRKKAKGTRRAAL